MPGWLMPAGQVGRIACPTSDGHHIDSLESLTCPAANDLITCMLGRQRRTTRLDVGLALAFCGTAYLVWALVAGISRATVAELFKNFSELGEHPESLTAWVKLFFVDVGFAIDLVGLVWLAGSLFLIVLSSRQLCSISWAWVSAICQSSVAAIGAVLVGWAIQRPYFTILKPLKNIPEQTALEQVSGFSLPLSMVAAVLIWVAFMVWLLTDRARLSRRGPTLRDGLRSNVVR